MMVFRLSMEQVAFGEVQSNFPHRIKDPFRTHDQDKIYFRDGDVSRYIPQDIKISIARDEHGEVLGMRWRDAHSGVYHFGVIQQTGHLNTPIEVHSDSLLARGTDETRRLLKELMEDGIMRAFHQFSAIVEGIFDPRVVDENAGIIQWTPDAIVTTPGEAYGLNAVNCNVKADRHNDESDRPLGNALMTVVGEMEGTSCPSRFYYKVNLTCNRTPLLRP